MRKKGMKLLSKIVAACFALILTVSMAMPVQAQIAKNEKHTITVTGKKTDVGATVDVYKIINVKFDYETQQPINPTYVWVDEVANWLNNNDDDNLKKYVENGNEVPKTFEKVKGAELSNLMRSIKDAMIADEIKLDPIVSGTIKTRNYQIVFEGMDMGQYLILTTSDKNGQYANYEYAPVTANITPVYEEREIDVDGEKKKVKQWFADDVNVTLKGSPAEIEKTVNDHTVEVGQQVNYTVNVPVPYYPADATAELFRIGDLLPLGITFGQTHKENNLKVRAVYENGDKILVGTSENRVNDYFELHYDVLDFGRDGIASPLEEGKNGHKATFLLDFKYDALMKDYGVLEKNENVFKLKDIEVTYTGTINENAILRPGDPGYPEDADPLENKAYVGQNNNPYDLDSYEPTDDKEKVYTYAVNVAKVAEDGKTPLDGAQFQLYTDKEGKNPVKFVELKKDAKDKDGNLVKSGVYRKAKEDETETTINLEVANGEANKGKLALEGLTTGTYYLKETKAPDGYEILKDVIEVKIVDEDEDGIVDNAGDKVDKSANTNIVYKTVVNRKPPIIPVTGGMGTILFSIVGIILVVGGVTLITTYLRRKRA